LAGGASGGGESGDWTSTGGVSYNTSHFISINWGIKTKKINFVPNSSLSNVLFFNWLETLSDINTCSQSIVNSYESHDY